MTRSAPKTYRFHSTAQWQTCLFSGFDLTSAGQLALSARLGLHAIQLTQKGPVSIVAADAWGQVMWRRPLTDHVPAAAAVAWLNEFGVEAGPFEVVGTLATSPRWIVDRDGIWALSQHPPQVERFSRESLQPLFTVDLANVAGATESGDSPEVALDIAGDGHDGVWVLVRPPGHVYWLLHIDCAGRYRGRLQVPCRAGAISQIACVGGGKNLVLLEREGTEIWLMDAVTGVDQRSVLFNDIRSRWTASRLAADGRNTILVGGTGPTDQGMQWSLMQFDASCELRDGPLANLFARPSDWDTSVSMSIPHDLTMRAGAAWFGLPDGVWRVDSSDASGARGSVGTLLTPAMFSPHTDAVRGWLRAEVDIDLAAGAALTAEVLSTNDSSLALLLQQAANDGARPSAARQQYIWSSLRPVSAPISITGPSDAGQPVSIPLFATQDQWLFLRLTLVVPPGVALPTLRELRVLYPETSINRYLPAMFRSPDGDSGAVLRRLVGVLEATTQGLDSRIASIGSHIDPKTADPGWFDYLASWLDLPWDGALPAQAKRSILVNAGDLLEKRGTRAGLQLLLSSLLGPGSSASIVDTAVDTPLTPVGGRGQPGARLPLLLVGTSRRVARLNGKAKLGQARLPCSPFDCNPLRIVRPTVRLALGVARTVRDSLEPIISSLLAQYLPAGLRLTIRWGGAPEQDDGLFLDADGPRNLGDNSVLGQTILAGQARGRLDSSGLTVGFRVH